MQLKLSFPIFNANQLFSPILGDHKSAKERLKQLSLQTQTQIRNRPQYPSKKLPANIEFTFLVNRDNFDVPALLLLAHELLSVLRLHIIIQDTNNRCISHITVSHKFVDTPEKEGCIVDFKD